MKGKSKIEHLPWFVQPVVLRLLLCGGLGHCG